MRLPVSVTPSNTPTNTPTVTPSRSSCPPEPPPSVVYISVCYDSVINQGTFEVPITFYASTVSGGCGTNLVNVPNYLYIAWGMIDNFSGSTSEITIMLSGTNCVSTTAILTGEIVTLFEWYYVTPLGPTTTTYVIDTICSSGSCAPCGVVTPTPTPTNTQTPTVTPTVTVTPSPFPICPEQLELRYFSGGTFITPPAPYNGWEGTYNRVYSYTGGTFVGGFGKLIPPKFFPGAVDYAPIAGRTYAVYERTDGFNYYTLTTISLLQGSIVDIRTTGTSWVNGGIPINPIGNIGYTAITDGSVYYPPQGINTFSNGSPTGWYVSYPEVCPTTTPTPTNTVTPTPTNTPGLPPTPTPTITPTNTITPSITPTNTASPLPPTEDLYLAYVYDCFDCSQIYPDIVAFPIGTPVTIGYFYNDEFVSGVVYEIINTTTTGPASVNCILPGQPTCAQACSL